MKASKAFLQVFDKIGSKILSDGGYVSEDVYELAEDDNDWYADEVIYESQIGEVLDTELVGNGDHHVEKEDIYKVEDRFFKISYIGVGKDLDEYVDYSIAEVVPKVISKTIYVTKK